MSVCDTARCHRECAREEILERIRLRDNAILAYLGASAVVFGVALGSNESVMILFIIPYFSLAASTIVAQHDSTIGVLSSFLTQELEPYLLQAGEWAPSWESSIALSRYAFKAINLRTISHLVIVMLPAVVSLVQLRYSGLLATLSFKVLWCVGLLVALVGLLILVDVHVSRQRRYKETTWISRQAEYAGEKIDNAGG